MCDNKFINNINNLQVTNYKLQDIEISRFLKFTLYTLKHRVLPSNMADIS